MKVIQYPWDPVIPKPDKPTTPAGKPRRPRGRPPNAAGRGDEPGWLAPLAMPGQGAAAPCPAGADRVITTDWLYHRLTVSGPDAAVARFVVAAAGAGVIPWRLDIRGIEDDLFHRLITGCARTRLSLDGCRAFAAQFRDKIEVRQARALGLVGSSQNCPFDLHALLPVPERLLALGPEDPRVTDWLRAHWGTLALRQVVVLPPRPGRTYLPPGHRAMRFGFFAADWSPWAALRDLQTTWAELRLDLQPVYDRD